MPPRSTVSANTVCGSNPETKVFAQTVWAMKPVATRIARSGRKPMPSATRPAPSNAGQASLRAITPSYRCRRSKSVKLGRIVDQDFLAGAGVGRPYRELVEQPSVVDLEQRRHVGNLFSRGRHRVRMGPVGAPYDTIGIRRDQRFGERDHVGIVRALLGSAIGAGDLH